MSIHHDWIEIDIFRIDDSEDWEQFSQPLAQPFAEHVGRVYERKCFAYKLTVLARERVLKHSRVTPGRTYIALVNGIGEVARSTDGV